QRAALSLPPPKVGSCALSTTNKKVKTKKKKTPPNKAPATVPGNATGNSPPARIKSKKNHNLRKRQKSLKKNPPRRPPALLAYWSNTIRTNNHASRCEPSPFSDPKRRNLP